MTISSRKIAGLHLGDQRPEDSFKEKVEKLIDEIKRFYLDDQIPWVVGYSGGKDSTAVLQLVWLAISELSREQRQHKPIFVISTDTLVENPIVSMWVSNSLQKMAKEAKEQSLPITSHKLTPRLQDTFWVNLIGKGYPAPRPKLRWCTDRLKINPSNDFIKEKVHKYGETILVLGTRKSESNARARVMERLESQRIRDHLVPNTTLANSWVYSPIETWSNDDVWTFLVQEKNPWGYNNEDLLTMYQGATADGECPLVVDTSTPSCGDSRFGCWVCTMVEQDRSMRAMIQNDEEKDWMLPLLKLRNNLDPPKTPDKDRHLRESHRMDGHIYIFNGRPVPGPYTKLARESWLRQVLKAQMHLRKNGPKEIREIELITVNELEEIRRIWVLEKHEIEDTLPAIFSSTTGKPYPGQSLARDTVANQRLSSFLNDICEKDHLHYKLVRNLLSIEQQHKSKLRRKGIFKKIDKVFQKFGYDTNTLAVEEALRRHSELNSIMDSKKNKNYVDSTQYLSNFKNQQPKLDM